MDRGPQSSWNCPVVLEPHLAFPGGSAGKESTCNAGDTGDMCLIPGLGRSAGGGHGNLLHYSCLEKRSLAGYSSQGYKELDTTEATEHRLPLRSPPFPGLDDASWNHTESSSPQSQSLLEGIDVHRPFCLNEDGDFLGGLVAKTERSQRRGPRFDPSLGN